MAEERGFECLLFPEHTHIPAEPEVAVSGRRRAPVSLFSRTYDPFVALAAAAMATERLLIGTGICLVIERDPIVTAKEVASVDVLSGGRFLFGVGAGWNAEEMRNHGTEPSRRFSLMRERIEAMKAIWTEDEASYSGRYVEFERSGPGPSRCRSPIRRCSWGATGRECSTGCSPTATSGCPTGCNEEELATRIAELNARAAEAGRDPIPVTVVGMAPDPARIERLAGAGVASGGVLASARERRHGRGGLRSSSGLDGAVPGRGRELGFIAQVAARGRGRVASPASRASAWTRRSRPRPCRGRCTGRSTRAAGWRGPRRRSQASRARRPARGSRAGRGRARPARPR